MTADAREHQVPHWEFIMVTKQSVAGADTEGFVNILYPIQMGALRETGESPVR